MSKLASLMSFLALLALSGATFKTKKALAAGSVIIDGLGNQGQVDPDTGNPVTPVFDRIFEPIFGELGTTKGIATAIHEIGGDINHNINLIHDNDHGVRICDAFGQFQDPNFPGVQMANQGVCFPAAKCRFLDGARIGGCGGVPTSFTTCCRFDRRCGGQSEQTVTYFRGPANPDADECRLKITSRLGACQIRVDFVDFTLPPGDSGTGECDPDSSLEVISDGIPPGAPRFFCGVNSFNHFYIPVSKGQGEEFEFVVRNKNGGSNWNIRITQVDCRTNVQNMRDLRAPDGCLQYFNARRGALASFNYNGQTPAAPGQKYSICFLSNTTVCGLALKAEDFGLPGGTDSFIQVQDALDAVGTPLEKDKFHGGDELKDPIATTAKPFVIRVQIAPLTEGGDEMSRKKTGFLMGYELLTKC